RPLRGWAICSTLITSKRPVFGVRSRALRHPWGSFLSSFQCGMRRPFKMPSNRFARDRNGGLVLPVDITTITYRDLIITLAARHGLPAVYPSHADVAAGGLRSYGPDTADLFYRAASYVDRILRGEKAADLPVQAPVKFELAINLKTAKALGLEVPPSLLAR